MFHSQTGSDLPNGNLWLKEKILTGKDGLPLLPSHCLSPQVPLPAPQVRTTHHSSLKMCSLSRTDLPFRFFLLHSPTPSRCPFSKCRKTYKLCQCDYKHLPFIDYYYVEGFQSTYMHSPALMRQAEHASSPFYRCSKPDSESSQVERLARGRVRPPNQFDFQYVLAFKEQAFNKHLKT